MIAATQSIQTHTAALAHDGRMFKAAGLAAAMVLPALFWVAVIGGLGHAAGFSFAASGLALTGTAISLFLGAVCAPIMLKA